MDEVLRAKWHALHTDYVMAHAAYLRTKLMREAAQGQPIDPNGALMAKDKLISVQMAMSDFCQKHAQCC
jgi:hypothetical protein